MRLSTKSRFAVTAMIDIALRENAGPVSLAGSLRFRISPTKNKSPASTPANGRKRSNRSETTLFLSFVGHATI